MLRPCFQSRTRIYDLYGAKEGPENTWAVVTGGSDGIGLELCHILAKQGFNICIVSRTLDKIETKLAEIRENSGNASI
jgi:short-subunit dehydrogenase